jgi:hypothetical protein
MNAKKTGVLRGHDILFSSIKNMNLELTNHIDKLIDEYTRNHAGEPPLYIVVSPDESKMLRESIRKKNDHPEEYVITTYRDIKIAEHPALLNGKSYVSSELPETGS